MNDNPDISDDMLLKLAGERAFTLGKAYFEQALVGELKTRGKATTAAVKGNPSGKVRLHYTLKGLEGSCDCPVSDGIDFCEHCVAAALALRAQKSQPALKKSARPTEVLTTYFERQNKEHLISTLVNLINSDKALRQEWLLQADQALGRLDKATLRKRITSAIPYKAAIHRYHRVRKYFADIEKALDKLKSPIEMLPADQQIELLDYAFERINRATDTVDDSGGYRYGSLEMLQGMYQSAFSNLDWNNDRKAHHLIQLMMNDEYGFYGEIPTDYVSSVSPECLSLFYQKVQEQWDALPKWKGGQWGVGRQYSSLLRILEVEALETNDYARLIELNEKVAVSSPNYLQLAEWCLALNDHDKAQHYIDKAKTNPHYANNHRAQKLQQEVLIGTGHSGQALEEQWIAFKQHCDLEGYRALKAMADRSSDKRNWYKLAVEHLTQFITTANPPYRRQHAVSTLGWIYLEEQDTEALWQLIEQDKIDSRLLHEFGKQAIDQPERVFLIYQRLVEFQVARGNNDGYLEAISLLKELPQLLPAREHREKLQGILQQLCKTFRAKRNFITWLNEAFPEL